MKLSGHVHSSVMKTLTCFHQPVFVKGSEKDRVHHVRAEVFRRLSPRCPPLSF